MDIPYHLAGVWQHAVRAIFIIESDENPQAVGDGGRAYGLGQMHPCFMQEYYRESGDYPASVSDTWVEAQVKTAATFFAVWEHMGLDWIVRAYNQGAGAIMRQEPAAMAASDGYLARFDEAHNRIMAAVE